MQRIFAHRSIAEPLARRIADQARALVVGDPTSPQTEVGPLIRHDEVERVDAWVREAVDGGATLLCGGRHASPSCYEPTVLLEPPAHCRVSTQEVFGPVVCVYAYDDLDEAIARVNALPVAFQAAVFTRDHATAMRTCARLDASAVLPNDHTAFRVDWMPFAGLRESGLGVGGIPTPSGTCRSRRCSLDLCHETPYRGSRFRRLAYSWRNRARCALAPSMSRARTRERLL